MKKHWIEYFDVGDKWLFKAGEIKANEAIISESYALIDSLQRENKRIETEMQEIAIQHWTHEEITEAKDKAYRFNSKLK